MSDFDLKASDWDKNPNNISRTKAVAATMIQQIQLNKEMKALEYGAGTALLSFALKENLGEITLMDNSTEMTRISNEKINYSELTDMKALFFDLEHEHHHEKYDIIYSQMVMHHIENVDAMLYIFYQLLHPLGYIAIADLYPEDGSFHGEGFNGHLGFDLNEFIMKLKIIGFANIKHENCYTIKKQISDGSKKEFPIFLISAFKER
jgi:predicted TPR repeat methyltransferase